MRKTSWHDFRTQLLQQAEEQGVPISGVFELTARCNLKCQMCYIRRPAGDMLSRSQELTAGQWLSLAKQARDAGMLYVLLTGGEVFLRPDIREIYEGIVGLGLIPTIFTNAALITPEILHWLTQTPPERVEVTLYGASPESYQNVCAVAGAYEKVVYNIDALLAAGIDVRLKTTVIPENKEDYGKLMQFAEQRGISLRFCFYISPTRVDAERRVTPMPRLNSIELSKYLYRASSDFQKLSNVQEEKTECAEDPWNRRSSPAAGAFAKCSAGRTVLWFTWEGLMTGCGLMTTPNTRPLDTGFQQAYADLGEKMLAIPSCDECNNCKLKELCLTCPVRLKNETGHFDKPAKYLCEFARHQSKYYS